MDQFETAKQFFAEGLRLLAANDFQAAEIQFAESLGLLPGRLSTLNNLSVVKIKLKKFAGAEEFARQAIALENKSPEAWSNLGIALAATKRPEEALSAYDRALDHNSAYAAGWLNKAMTLLELERFQEALVACDEAMKLNPGQYEVAYTKSRILKELGQLAEAKKIYGTALELRVVASPVFSIERRATQKADILIVSQNPEMDDSLKSFEDLHAQCLNFPGQLPGIFHDDFHFSFVYEGIANRSSARRQIPRPDLILNNNSNGEGVLAEGNLPGMIALVDSFGVPVINHPAKVVQSTRDMSVKLLKDAPGVVVPKTMRFSSAEKTREELVHEIEGQFDYPLITRTLASQMGKGMTKVDSRAAFSEAFAAGLPEKFFVTQFIDTRGENKFFRKIRAAIVQDEIVIVRVDFDTYWNVHGRKSEKRVPFYLENLYLLEDEKRICADPEKELGRAAVQALQTIRERTPLDVFGMDFDVDAAGRIVFYEANATMNLFSTAQKQVPNPQMADDRLKLAFHRYFTSLAARR